MRRRYHVEDTLVISKLSRHYGVSEMTLREALLRLEWEGFVVSRPKQSPVVREFSFEELVSLYHSCGVLEGHAARLGAARIRENTLEAMRRVNLELHDAWQRRHPSRCEALGREFDLLLYRAGASKLLVDEILALWRRLELLREMLIAREPPPLYDSYPDHLRILELLEAREPDGDAVERAVRDHKLRVGYRLGYGLPPGVSTPVQDLGD